jgi:Domain of unknown function (DUF5060)/Protein of unknown function (DUF4038)/Domain of unknown function (DUF5605)
VPTINRREMLRLGSAASLAAYALAESEAQPTAGTESAHAPVPQWEVFELVLAGPAQGNPFTDVRLSATFTLGYRSIPVQGFYDGDGQYRIRFMPDTQGEWSYVTESSAPELADKSGQFACAAPLPGAHGPVRVRNSFHFGYADGTPFFPFGTTCYAWVHQSESLQEQTLKTLSAAPFNKIRMCVFPKSYEYNHNEPPFYPFVRSASGVSDFTRPNPEFFRHLEKRIGDLRALGIESDLILFHPYDRWGYSTMSRGADELYLRYVLARFSAYRNIWWSMANEYDLMRAKSTEDFDRYFQLVQQEDPVGHLRSIHFSHILYDYSRPWVTHGCLQSAKFEQAPEWLQGWQKPICFDEVMYEGNLNRRWGNISGEEMARRFWLGMIAGCYVTHGETYLDPNGDLDESTTPTLWWSHGGTLKGSSPARIGFLRKLVEESNAGVAPARAGLEAQTAAYYLNASVLGETRRPETILYYMDLHQPVFYEFPLPEGSFIAELIDPWEMNITPVAGAIGGKTKLKLTARPFQALRFRRVT